MGSDRATLVFDERLINYDFGPSHPLNPVRVALTIQLARELGVLERLDVVTAEPCSDEELATVHTRAYIERVAALSADPTQADPSVGLGTPDNPVFGGMHEVGALVGGASVEAARRVWTGQSLRAANIAGGLHHAMAGCASGFCIYNDPALAIRWLLDHGAERVAYVDVDAHHGDGVQAIFYDDPRVLTVSIHESPQSLFPGTGYATETGGPGAEGSAVNVALPAGTSDAGWLRAFHAVVPPLVRAFEPQILVTQLGCDTHRLDPLAHLDVSVDAHRHSYAALHRLAHEVTGGRWVAVGGGGYEIVQVVPRSWTHLLAEITGHPLDPDMDTPQSWRDLVRRRTGREGPKRLTDGTEPVHHPWDAGEGDPDDPVDRAIAATRRAVFADHGLDHIDPR
jgi:acetoin utilization protein AcuC